MIGKKWISNIKVTKYVFIWNVIFRLRRTCPQKIVPYM